MLQPIKIKTMKRRHFLFLLFILIYITRVNGQTNWSIISQPGKDIIIVNQTTGYSFINETVGSHGMKYTLNKSTDGFQTFNTIKTKIGDFGCYSLDEMFYIDADTGFIAELCQGLTSIYKTVDGGQTWTETGFGGTYGISMYFLNENNGYYSFFPGAGNDSYLMKNGSAMFTTKKYILTKDNYQYPNNTTKIKFINDSTGFIICKDTLDNAVILKTTNFGNNWSEKKLLNNNSFKDIYFISDSVGFVIGTNGYVLKTNDYGNNWESINSNTSNCLNSIDFSNDSIGYIVGNSGELLKTLNQGLTWNSETFSNSTDLIYVRTFYGGNIYINDNQGNLYSNNTSSIANQNTSDDISIYPNPTKDLINVLISPSVRNYKIILYSIQGEKILTTNENLINLGNMNSGVYLITVMTDNQIYKEKIIKQ